MLVKGVNGCICKILPAIPAVEYRLRNIALNTVKMTRAFLYIFFCSVGIASVKAITFLARIFTESEIAVNINIAGKVLIAKDLIRICVPIIAKAIDVTKVAK